MDNQTLFSANLMELLGLQNLPEEQRAKLLERMTQVVQDRISNRVVGMMTETQRSDMDVALAANASPSEMDVFMKKCIPNFEEIVAEEILKFKGEMKENTDAVRQTIASAAA